ncbi:rhodanese-like domain-containing protein [Muricauda sp. 2012CJ35-5]|uniref:Rhodanese-like domain-containing protein n=1 Tax=Flagellimonas spongiicola TaxID=2942208 RepID=A0ABT0PT10_9FLAO|nr:rhodanese-like domain-containing protein [Allomuricauda spongiicola]MCL6274527.1 rhodanese-like domain-containing protein [Allomuricauda spongiicola]
MLKYCLSLVCGLLMLSCQPKEKSTITKIDKQTLIENALDKDVQLIDVRTPQEFAAGSIGQAINLNVNDANFSELILDLDKEKPVYLFCKKGGRSNRAAQIFKENGFTNIYDYSGGYDDWVKSGK